MIKILIGDFELGIGVFRIGISQILRTPTPNSKSPIGHFIANW